MNNWVVYVMFSEYHIKLASIRSKPKQNRKAQGRRKTRIKLFRTCLIWSLNWAGVKKHRFAPDTEWRYPVSMVSTTSIQMIVELNLCYEHHYLYIRFWLLCGNPGERDVLFGPSTQPGQIRRCDLVNMNLLAPRIPVMRESTRVQYLNFLNTLGSWPGQRKSWLITCLS